MHEMDGAKTIAEFKSELIVLGENYCNVENERVKPYSQISVRGYYQAFFVTVRTGTAYRTFFPK